MKNKKLEMNTRRYITDDFAADSMTGTLRISGDEFHHLKHVNRAKTGDIIEVVNGNGTLFSGEIRVMHGHEAIVDVREQHTQHKPRVTVTMAPSLLKPRSMTIVVEKLAEIGIDEIRPVIFARTDEKYSPSRLKKWTRVANQSLKVNKRLWGTNIYPPVTLEQVIALSCPFKARLLLDITG
ncbi:MAG: RsmE family RNA methyltransferase, partial [bacterium]|nr:RsmE family RNA methyltransferase [bacterium]